MPVLNTISSKAFRSHEDPALFDALLKLRLEVFIDEQHCDPALDHDEIDARAIHWAVFSGGAFFSEVVSPENPPDAPIATGRLYDEDPARAQGALKEPRVAKIGRMAVRKSHRGKGLGRRIIIEMLDRARQEGYDQVVLDAQCHAEAFYAQLGFVPEGDTFYEENILHIKMRQGLRPFS